MKQNTYKNEMKRNRNYYGDGIVFFLFSLSIFFLAKMKETRNYQR